MTPVDPVSADTEKSPLPHGPEKPSSVKISRRLVYLTSWLAIAVMIVSCVFPWAFADVPGNPNNNPYQGTLINMYYETYLETGTIPQYFKDLKHTPYFFMEDQDGDAWTGIINAVNDMKTNDFIDATHYADWGWARESINDPSLPHDNLDSQDTIANPVYSHDWQQYHSLATFCAQCGWALTNTTRSSWATSNSQVTPYIAPYSTDLYNAALWLTNHSSYTDTTGKKTQEGKANGQIDVQLHGMTKDAPFSHRRMMLAAVLFQATALNPSNSSFYSDLVHTGEQDAMNGLACQLPPSSYAVLEPATGSKNIVPPATFYSVPGLNGVPGPYNPPSDPNPPGVNMWDMTKALQPSDKFISGSGVTTEEGGFDISYETNYASLGIYAADSYTGTTYPYLKSQMYAQIDQSLLWLASRLKYNCTALDESGCSRDGVELDNALKIKHANLGSVSQTYLLMATRSANPAFADTTDSNNVFHEGLWHKIYDNTLVGHNNYTDKDTRDLDDDSAKASWHLGTRTYTPFDLNFTLYPSILWQHPGSSNNIAVVVSTTSGVNSTDNTLIAPQASGSWNTTLSDPWKIVGVADADGDGQPDYLWYDATHHSLAIWYMKPGGITYKSYGSNFAAPSDGNWQVVSFTDMNGDGRPDILWYNSHLAQAQQLMVWFTYGPSVTTPTSTTFSGTSEANWQVIGTGDYNSDGNPDILWYNPTKAVGQRFTIWLMPGFDSSNTLKATPVYGPYFSGTSATGWQPVGTGDYNDDGHPDILWQNPTSKQLIVWYIHGVAANGGTVGIDANGTTIGRDETGVALAPITYGNAFGYGSSTLTNDTNWQVVGVH